jgi:hypothetical protein
VTVLKAADRRDPARQLGAQLITALKTSIQKACRNGDLDSRKILMDASEALTRVERQFRGDRQAVEWLYPRRNWHLQFKDCKADYTIQSQTYTDNRSTRERCAVYAHPDHRHGSITLFMPKIPDSTRPEAHGKLREQAFKATLECLGQTIQQLRPRTGRVRLAMPRYIGCSEQGRTRRGRKQWARHLELIKVFCQQHPSVIISVWHEPAEHDKFDDEHINGVVRSRVAAYMDSHDHNKDGPIWHPDSECQQYGAESFTDGMEVVASTTAKRIAKMAGITDTANCRSSVEHTSVASRVTATAARRANDCRISVRRTRAHGTVGRVRRFTARKRNCLRAAAPSEQLIKRSASMHLPTEL